MYIWICDGLVPKPVTACREAAMVEVAARAAPKRERNNILLVLGLLFLLI